MRSLSRIECFNVGCTNEASVTINGDHVCTQCARADLSADVHEYLPARKQADPSVCTCQQRVSNNLPEGCKSTADY